MAGRLPLALSLLAGVECLHLDRTPPDTIRTPGGCPIISRNGTTLLNELRDCPGVPFFTVDPSAEEPLSFPDDPNFRPSSIERLAAGSPAALARAERDARLKELRAMQLAPASVSAAACQGCDVTLDFRCQGLQRPRSSFMHRLTDCLIPRYGLVAKARKLHEESKGQQTCILTWFNDREATVEPLLKLLIYDMNVRFITEDIPCAKDMKYWTQQPHWNYGARSDYIAAWPGLTKVAGRVAMNPASNMRSFLLDVQVASIYASATRDGPVSWPPAPKMVLVARPRSSERAFSEVAEHVLQSMLYRIVQQSGQNRKLQIQKTIGINPVATNASFVIYKGEETIKDTLSMFANSVLTVGYHGAGLVNTLFAQQPSCVEEITTHRDVTGSALWRSHGHLQHVNPYLVWQTLRVPLQMLLDANHVTDEEWSRAKNLNITNHFIQKLTNIQVAGMEVVHLQRQIAECLEKNIYLSASD